MNKEQQPQQPIIIQPDDVFIVHITGADYAAIEAGLKELRYSVAAPLLGKLEKQIIEQIQKP